MSLDAYLPHDRPVIRDLLTLLRPRDLPIREVYRGMWACRHEKEAVEQALKVLTQRNQIIIDRAWVRLVRRGRN